MKSVNKKRVVERLEDIENINLMEVYEKKQLDLYENELSIINNTSPFENMPDRIGELPEKAQYMMYYYLTPGIENDYALKETKGDLLLSYIMTFEEWKEISNSLWQIEEVNVGTYDNPMYEKVSKKRNPMLFAKWNMRATSYWSEFALDSNVDTFRKILSGNINREEELKDAIWQDAMYAKDDRIRDNNRKLYVDISGMKRNQGSNIVNVYRSGGGEELSKELSDFTGSDKYNIIDVIPEELK